MVDILCGFGLGIIFYWGCLRLFGPSKRYYRHAKGGKYLYIGEGRHTETQEELVAYKSMADGRYWFRPTPMFYEPDRFKEI